MALGEMTCIHFMQSVFIMVRSAVVPVNVTKIRVTTNNVFREDLKTLTH